MSVNLQGALRNIKWITSWYDPLIEAIVNAIQAIQERNNVIGQVIISFEKDKTPRLWEWFENNNYKDIIIHDNGIWLNAKNLASFDELYTENKYQKWGKWFGRLMYLKYFENVEIESIYEEDWIYRKINFIMGRKNNIVENPVITDLNEASVQPWTTITLKWFNWDYLPKNIDTIWRDILGRLLMYFISSDSTPEIVLNDEKTSICINDIVKKNKDIVVDWESRFQITWWDDVSYEFEIKFFKIFSPGSQKSKIILGADNREVISISIADYITEFSEDFIEYIKWVHDELQTRNYIIKAYVLAKYLNDHVTIERNDFNFNKEKDLLHPISQKEIENQILEILKQKYIEHVTSRRERKTKKVEDFLQKEWFYYAEYKNKINLDTLPMNPSEEQLDNEFHKIKYFEERTAKNEISTILKKFDQNIEDKIQNVFAKISTAQRSDLTKYISLRKVYLDVFKKALELSWETDSYQKESLVHSIVFPVKKDSDTVDFKDNNLWLLDERLNFVEYINSDQPFVVWSKNRIDLVCYDQKITTWEAWNTSNPITIFEFKKPGRDDFVNPSNKEDPYEQIIRYITQLKNGEIKTPLWRTIVVDAQRTPFYAYIVADFSPKIKERLIDKDFKQLPNGWKRRRWHDWHKLYIEYITRDQLLKDAEERNSIFFHKLWI